MAISDRITSIEEHIKESYQELEGIGIDTIGVDKNLENIPKLIDGYWETLPKVAGEGTSITLDNTKEGKMKIVLNGNTSQEGTPTPETPQDIHVVSGDNTINVTGKNLINTNVETKSAFPIATIGSVVSYGTSSASTSYVKCCYLEAGTTYTFSYNKNTPISTTFRDSVIVDKDNKVLEAYKLWNNSTYNIWTPTHSGYLILCVDSNSTELMLEKGNQATTYEPYQEQNYPINLGVENLLPTNSFTLTKGTNRTLQINFPTPIPEGTYTLSCKIKSKSGLTSSNGMAWALYDSSTTPATSRAQFTQIVDNTTNPFSSTKTTTGQSTHLYIYLQNSLEDTATITIEDLQLEKGNKSSSFSSYGATLYELCKIGTYQDGFIRNSGKNLFDKDSATIDYALNWTTGANYGESGSLASDYIPTTKGTQYRITYSSQVMYYDSNKEYLGCLQTGGTTIAKATGNTWQIFTTPNIDEIAYMRLGVRKSSDGGEDKTNKNIMLNYGSTLLNYEPYGNGDWYVEKNTGKMILNGTENWSIQTSWSAVGDKTNAFYITRPTEINPGQSCYCDYLKYVTANTIVTTDEYGISYSASLILRMPKTLTDGNALKTYLASNNMKLYYALLNPTYTKIEGTLKEQLEKVWRANSYKGTTNISQENNDLASLLNATALEEM